MSRSDQLSYWIEFASGRFDSTSELPEGDNAGNRLYGRDLAELIVERLNARGFETSYGDEDWGWLVDGRPAGGTELWASESDRTQLWIGVYHVEDPDTRDGVAEWALNVQAFEPRKWLGLFSRRHQVEVDEHTLDTIREILREEGIVPTRFERGGR